jgi:hypothetical protein
MSIIGTAKLYIPPGQRQSCSLVVSPIKSQATRRIHRRDRKVDRNNYRTLVSLALNLRYLASTTLLFLLITNPGRHIRTLLWGAWSWGMYIVTYIVYSTD